MAAINDLIARIQDSELRQRIDKEIQLLTKQKKFGLVFENHVPEMTLLYDYPISRGCKVIRKADDDKKLSDEIIWEVKRINRGIATCIHTVTKEEQEIGVADIICVAKNGEPIYPCLEYVDSIQANPYSDLWHTLIEADNYHALQLLAYLYPGKVDCIYIDPPYNSGARDWKYNNDYVDANDKYPHSKWLAMMESRLLLAKKLLNPEDSVLIVTIDEKEQIHLGCLLEEMFPEARIQMVSTMINPAGGARDGEFGRSGEYIFFILFGRCVPNKIQLKREWVSTKGRTHTGQVRWDLLKRSGTKGAKRLDSPGGFYPIYINPQNGKIEKIGEPLPPDVHWGEDYDGCIQLLPIRKNGEEGRWQWKPQNLRDGLEKGRVKVGGNKDKGYTVYTLKDGEYDKVLQGVFDICDRGLNNEIIVEDIPTEYIKTVPNEIWKISTHDATQYGTRLIDLFLVDNRFSFPKSLYAVHDTLRFFVANKPNALILDFFAGSGTTLHAVNLLNKEDGGNRRCILVTNNEVSAEEETAFKARGIHKGDEEWERFGIARYVCWPRTKCSITGIDVNGNPIKGEYITPNTQEKTIKRTIKQLSFDIPDGTTGVKIKKQLVALINDKNMPQNSVTQECPYIVKDDATAAVLFDVSSIDDFIEEIHDGIETIYVTTSNNKTFNAVKNELKELPDRVVSEPVQIPMSEGFKSNAAFYKLKFLDKETVSIGAQLDKLLSILWMKAGAHGVCPEHAEGEYMVFPENKMAILIDEYGFDDLKAELEQIPEIETVYIIDDSEDNYRNLAAQLKVKNTYQLYRDYLDNFKINIERRQ